MVGGVEVVRQRKRTVAVTEVRVVPGRGDDPIVPAHIAEIDVQRVPPAIVLAAFSPVLARAHAALSPRQHFLLVVPGVGDQHGLELRPPAGVLAGRPLQPYGLGLCRVQRGHQLDAESVVVLGVGPPPVHGGQYVEHLPGARGPPSEDAGVEQSLDGVRVRGPHHVEHLHPVDRGPARARRFLPV